jgi:hypothetical protein
MTDKMEPVAWTSAETLRWMEAGGSQIGAIQTEWMQDGVPVPLYTADQVKELTDRLEKAEGDAGAALHRSLTLAVRATTAEAALAEARKVIEREKTKWLCSQEDCTPYDYGRDEGLEIALDAICAQLQANKGDA